MRAGIPALIDLFPCPNALSSLSNSSPSAFNGNHSNSRNAMLWEGVSRTFSQPV